MKILQVVNSLECGGAEKMVIHLSKGQIDKGNHVVILCLGVRGELAKEAEEKGVKVFHFNKQFGFDLRIVFKLVKFINKNDFDLIHTHNMRPLIYGSLASRFIRKPVINTRHGSAKKVTKPFIWNSNNRIILISNDSKRELLKYNKSIKVPVSVVYNGINLNEFNSESLGQHNRELRKGIGISESSFIIGIVARLSVEKDHATLIKAFKLVFEQKGNVDLFIVGDGSVRQSLEVLVSELNIKSNVKFLGFRDDIPQVLHMFDVFVLSSLTEGVSLTLLEAMAASKPIVATNVGGNSEVVIDMETGLLVPSKDPQSMADAILKILSDKEMSERMGKAGRKRVEEVFNLERMVDAYIEVYDNVIAKS